MAIVSNTELARLIAGGESITVELKVNAPRPADLAERMCAFANAQGGFIILGIADKSLQIVGVTDVGAAVGGLVRAARLVQPALNLEPPDPEVHDIDGKKVVVVRVPPSSGPIYQASGVFWIRRGTYSVPLSMTEMLELANTKGLIRWELQSVAQTTLADLDMNRVEAYLQMRSTRLHQGSRLDTIEDVLIGMDCAYATGTGETRPTNAGILFFGRNPQRFVPQSEVVYVRYRDALGLGGYADHKIATGTIQELIDKVEIFLSEHIAIAGTITGWKRIDTPEYPIEGLREAVVNAIIHRDYSRYGESIRIFQYTDRIEIHSPGLLLPGVTVAQMERGDVQSRLRNQVLANLLRDIPGYMERIGSGVRRMLYETKTMGLPPPHFRETSEFVVTFRKAPDETLTHVPDVPTLPQSTIRREEGMALEERLALAMHYVRQKGAITNREYRAMTAVSDRTAQYDLDKLVTRGVLRVEGRTRDRRYLLHQPDDTTIE